MEKCAYNLKLTAEDNLRFGYIDKIIQEPPLGARSYHFDFFRQLRQEILLATDEVVLSAKLSPFKKIGVSHRNKPGVNLDEMYMRWSLGKSAKTRLVKKRQNKFLKLSREAAVDKRPFLTKALHTLDDLVMTPVNELKYEFYRKHQRKIHAFLEEAENEWDVFKSWLKKPFGKQEEQKAKEAVNNELTSLSTWADAQRHKRWNYLSPRYKIDQAVTCPNASVYGCPDLWGPDLFAEFAGVCSNCGHHFPMEPEWYVRNVFDVGTVMEFNEEIEAGNPLEYPNFDKSIRAAQEKTGCKSGCMTFEARIDNIKVVVAMLMGTFRGGSFGAAEGYKFVEAAQRATKNRYPFIAYVHGTAGIRIQEGTNGVIQMPRCTIAVHRYIENGGLYMVLYDTNSFAGPVASFLGCSPYQFAIRSSNIGFAGPGVIKSTTGMDVPPHYHSCYKAMDRGHIQGIWDRRQMRHNLIQALQTIGGRNLYYR